jgi:hypothetical protein
MQHSDPEFTLRPSILLLEAAQGGIVNNTIVAARLIQLIIDLIGLSTNTPPTVQDDGDSWLANVSDGADTHPNVSIKVRKRDAAVLLSPEIERDALAFHADVESFSSVVIVNASGEDELQRQAPLFIEDRGETWLVRGNPNAGSSSDGPGPCYLEVRKKNGQVLDMWFEWVTAIPEEVKALFRRRDVRPTSI